MPGHEVEDAAEARSCPSSRLSHPLGKRLVGPGAAEVGLVGVERLHHTVEHPESARDVEEDVETDATTCAARVAVHAGSASAVSSGSGSARSTPGLDRLESEDAERHPRQAG